MPGVRRLIDHSKFQVSERFSSLPRGVSPGPSGERYEHVCAVADTSVGMHALTELSMLVADAQWDPAMRACRLTALYKGEPLPTPHCGHAGSPCYHG
jgi:hypothetical protein